MYTYIYIYILWNICIDIYLIKYGIFFLEPFVYTHIHIYLYKYIYMCVCIHREKEDIIYFEIYEIMIFMSVCGILDLMRYDTSFFNKMTFYPRPYVV